MSLDGSVSCALQRLRHRISQYVNLPEGAKMSNGIPDITPYLIHKEAEVDVLIKNPVLLLPSKIPMKVVAPDGSLWLTEARLYKKNDGESCFSSTARPVEELEDFFPLSPAELEHAGRPESTSAIADAREKISYPCVFGTKSGRSIAIRYEVKNQADHYYFYSKGHDHVPGIMLIEIARQAMYHYFYAQYSYLRGKVSISMSTLTAEFDAYAESCLPMTVIVQQSQAAYAAQPRYPAAIATFFQRGKCIGKIALRSSVLKKSVYEKSGNSNHQKSSGFDRFQNSSVRPCWILPAAISSTRRLTAFR